jgi:stage II sporulation protein D
VSGVSIRALRARFRARVQVLMRLADRAPRAILGALVICGLAAGLSRAASAPDDAAWGALAEERIRVGLAPSTADAVVSARGPFSVTVYSGATQRLSSAADEEWAFDAADGPGLRARSSAGGSFEIADGTVRMRPEGTGVMVVNGTAYRGEIEIYPAAPGSLAVVNVVGIESYLRGVVPGEIGKRPPEDMEAVKAQAIAARTYAAASSGARAGGDFDVLSTTGDQLYQGIDSEDAVCDQAVFETAGLVLTFEGKPAFTYFHSSCGGRTEARHEVWDGLDELPYLDAVWDTDGGGSDLDRSWCRGASSFTWTESWTGQEIARLVREELPKVASTPVREPVGELIGLKVTERTPAGRVRWLEVRTTGGTYRVLADRVRRLLRRPDMGAILRSTWFDLDVETDGGVVSSVKATGRGNGHGVGMCQHGALAMARAGRSCEEILAHYYPGTKLARLEDVW